MFIFGTPKYPNQQFTRLFLSLPGCCKFGMQCTLHTWTVDPIYFPRKAPWTWISQVRRSNQVWNRTLIARSVPLVNFIHVRDYVLMKTVFIGAIVGSGDGEDDDKEILIWWHQSPSLNLLPLYPHKFQFGMTRFVWLSLVGFLKHFGLLCRDRLEYMTLSIRSRSE